MDIPRNIQYTRLIKIDNRLREFNFRKRTPELYDADTNDERGTRFIFQLVKDDQTWKLNGKELPLWLRHHENEISAAIVTYESDEG